MIIYKCFLCNFESNNKTIVKGKTNGEVYLCPECKQSYGCLVETETQKEFPSDYMFTVIRNKDIPTYYGITIEKLEGKNRKVALQIFEIIDIKSASFVYGYINVPGMFTIISDNYSHLLTKHSAIIKPVGKNILLTIESKNPPNQIINYKTKSADNFRNIDIKIEIDKPNTLKLKEQTTKLKEQNLKLTKDLYGINIYKIITFNLNYLLSSPLDFKKQYKLPKPLITRLKKKYKITKVVIYTDFMYLNNLWHTYDIFYLGLPPLNNIDLWLSKARKSKAVCCGVVPFAPLANWYKEHIIDKAEIKLLKQQSGIPFPLVEFSYRYESRKGKPSLLTKTDIKLGQKMFNFSKEKK